VSDDLFSGGSTSVKRKRHPIRNILVTLVIMAALLVPGYFVAESLARSAATSYVQAGVQKELNVADRNDVHVSLGKGSIILQVLQGHIKSMKVNIDKFTTDSLTGRASITATGVPLSTSSPVTKMSIVVTVDANSMKTMIDTAIGSPTATVELAGDQVRIGTKAKLFGISVPASIDLTPSVAHGRVVLTPVAFTVNKKTYTAKELKASPIGAFVGGLLKAPTLCVASSLPRDLKLTNVAVSSDNVVVTVEGTGVPLSSLATKGSCVAS
jgi:hypothetical protein